jgi:hypothetical protein
MTKIEGNVHIVAAISYFSPQLCLPTAPLRGGIAPMQSVWGNVLAFTFRHGDVGVQDLSPNTR